MQIASIAVFSDADADAPYLALAGEAVRLGPPSPKLSYLDAGRIIAIALDRGADAIHPGYGFLSENAGFAREVGRAGLTFIGPDTCWLEVMGHKTRARELMARHGLPVAAGTGLLGTDFGVVRDAAASIGYPVLVKAAGGGGGIGLLTAHDETQLARSVSKASALAERSFADAQVYLEKYIERPRHIEFQVLADKYGNVRHLFERDCSVQRRHQKVIEESPAPGLDRTVLDDLLSTTTAILSKICYDNIGTVEMLMGQDGRFSFLEMNTRLQVEHAVTEMVTGVDLVVAQIMSAAGENLGNILPSSLQIEGHAMEARVYSEDPKTFFPSTGTLQRFRPPATGDSLTVETGYMEGSRITGDYDPMLAKVIVHAGDRGTAIEALTEALTSFEIEGVKTNIPFILAVLANADFRAGRVHTGLASEVG